MKKMVIFFLFLLSVIPVKGEEMKKHPGWAIIATAVLPGGGQFYFIAVLCATKTPKLKTLRKYPVVSTQTRNLNVCGFHKFVI